MSRHILISGFFFVYLMLVWLPFAYSQDEDVPIPTSVQLPENATVPNTQSTANMDSMNIARPNDTFMISPSDLNINGQLTTEAEMRLYKQVVEKGLRERDEADRRYRDYIQREISAGLNAAEELKLNKASGEYLPPSTVPDPQKVKEEAARKSRLSAPDPLREDDWDFLPDFIPGVSVYENMPEMPVAPEAVTSPQKGQAPAGGKSGGSSSSQDRGSELDLIVQ